MKKLIILPLLLLLNNAYTQGLNWVQTTDGIVDHHVFGSQGVANGMISAFDAFGYIYLVGANGYFEKYDTAGTHIWTHTTNITGYSVAADIYGFIYVVGISGSDMMLEKYDSAGVFIWGHGFSGNNNNYATNVIVDSGANIYITGRATATTDLDPGTGVFVVDTNSTFLAKYDSSGSFLWAYVNGNTYSSIIPQYAYGQALAIDAAGNVYCGMQFGSASHKDAYIVKFDDAGNFTWRNDYPGNQAAEVLAMTISDSGYLYVAGMIDYIPGGGGPHFLKKLDTAGVEIWEKRFGGAMFSWEAGIDVDVDGNIYITGGFGPGTVDFDPGSGQHMLTAGNNPALFLAKFNNNGELDWATAQESSLGVSHGYNIHADDQCNLYLTGTISGEADLDPGIGIYNVTDTAIFIEKITCAVTGIEQRRALNNIVIYPNPSTGLVNILCDTDIEYIQVTDVLGKIVYSSQPGKKSCIVDMKVSPGIYYLTAVSLKERVTKKILIE